MNKFILTILVLSMFLVTPMVMAAVNISGVTTLNNYTTVTFACAKLVADAPQNATLAYIYYNASGGPVSATATKLGSAVANDSRDDLYFTGFSDVSGLTDGLTYNFTCVIGNATNNATAIAVSSVGIDNTAPTKTLSWDKPSVVMGSPQEISWTTSDATSGISSVSVTITSENTDLCPTTTYTDEDFTAKQFLDTDCDGTYTVLLTATDTAGNIATEEETFDVLVPGASIAGGLGSDLASGIGKTTDTKGNNTQAIVLVVVIVIVIYFLIRKK